MPVYLRHFLILLMKLYKQALEKAMNGNKSLGAPPLISKGSISKKGNK